MAALSFRVRAWAAWSPGRECPDDWLAWAAGRAASGGQGPAAGAMPMLLRRRVSAIGQQALRAAWGLDGVAQSRLVFASRHGEFSRTLSIIDALVRQDEVSPAEFSLSVHHALAGLLSIATGNRKGHTTVAAGPESFAHALLEAAACLAEAPDEPVTLVYYDEPLSDRFADFADEDEEHLAMALSLSAQDGLALRLTPVALGQAAAAATARPALAFLGFLLGGGTSAEVVGERLSLRWEREYATA